MGSSRLPGKSMMIINGEPALWHVVNRVRKSGSIDKIVVATSTSPNDAAIDAFCTERNIPCYRGSEEDVLDRYYRSSVSYHPEIVVRITGDCPVIDPDIIGACIELYHQQPFPDCYVSNCIERTYPDGMDVEVFSYTALKTAWENANLASEREHVTPYIREHYPNAHLKMSEQDYSLLRLTLDYEDDAEVIRAMVEALAPQNEFFKLTDMVSWLEAHPEIKKLNAHHEINEGLQKSLREDRVVGAHIKGGQSNETDI